MPKVILKNIFLSIYIIFRWLTVCGKNMENERNKNNRDIALLTTEARNNYLIHAIIFF